MAASTDQDSPLSITSNVVGILTFVVAIEAAIYARVTYLSNSDGENFRVKTSLSWCKTKSAWQGGRLLVAMARLPVRTKALELVPSGGIDG